MCKIIWNTDISAPCCPGQIVDATTGRTILIQAGWDYPGTASTFGWSLSEVQAKQRTASFERFSLTLPREAIEDCSHPGPCDNDVELWADYIDRPDECTPEALRDELREYGAWDAEELADDAANWRRIIWLAAGNLKEEKCEHNDTDGTVDCKECGCTASYFINAAYDWLIENDGAEADDPGYFDGADDE